jgi:hypothetical protein
MKSGGMASLCAVALLVAKPVLAASAPPVCLQSARARLAYNAGVQLGGSLVQRAWQSVSDCGRLDRFAEMAREDINSYVVQGATNWAICRYTGVVDGAYDGLDAVWMNCSADCCAEGEVFGRLGADVYCQLSVLLDGLAQPDQFVPRPASTCSAFSDCCASSFRATSQDHCAMYTGYSDNPFVPFREIWEESLAIQCNVQ